MPGDSKVVNKVSGEVDLSREETEEVVRRFQQFSYSMKDMIEEQAVEGASAAEQAKGEGSPTFIYTVYENESVLAVGGAKTMMLGLAEQLDYDSVETKAVTRAHRLAAQNLGLAEHMVMDDVYMVPRDRRWGENVEEPQEVERVRQSRQRDGDDGAEVERRREQVEDVQESGHRLQLPEGLAESLDVGSERVVGVEVTADGDAVALEFDPRRAKKTEWVAVLEPGGSIAVPAGIADAVVVEDQEISWRASDGALTAVRESLSELRPGGEEAVRTSLVEDNIEGSYRATLPSRHANQAGAYEDDTVSLYVDAHDGELYLVVAARHNEYTPLAVDVENIGSTGTDMLSLTLPEPTPEMLGVEGEQPVEWSLSGDRLVGDVV